MVSNATYIISPEAYYKLYFHAAKHPHKSVNGVFLGKQSPPSPGGVVSILDIVPLLHHWTSLSPMMEIGLDLANQHAESEGLVVVGYYQACERIDDIALAPVGEKVAGRIRTRFPDAIAFVLDGQKLGSGEAALVPYDSVGSTDEWRPSSGDKLPFGAGSRFQFQSPDIPTEASRLVREQNLHYAFGDFDDHLEDVTIEHVFLNLPGFKFDYINVAEHSYPGNEGASVVTQFVHWNKQRETRQQNAFNGRDPSLVLFMPQFSHGSFVPLPYPPSPSLPTTTSHFMMSLLTPPRSSHRGDNKENRFVVAQPAPLRTVHTVLWVEEDEVHSLSTPFKTATISSKDRPAATRSILKKAHATLAVPVDAKQRECTPEPHEISLNDDYLTSPLSQIINANDDPNVPGTLSTLIQGYNVLAARLRRGIAEPDVDSSWPLFQPLRQNADAFVDAMVRDLGRAFVDPVAAMSNKNADDSAPKCCLPSPQKSPSKKKDGLTGEQAKFARDLCATCHSVIRLLGVILSLPSLYNLFEESQLRRILSAVLAIPLADDLPTLNARKTCSLIIWLIQNQRLPLSVLQPAADRIAYALRRGIEGELGREGKKGAAADGLKAIADLCEHLPDVFVPAFFPLLPSVLVNLVAYTLTLRMHACHAFCGYVLALTSLPRSPLITKVSNLVATYLTCPGTPTKAASPTTLPEAAIIRTLRSTVAQTDPEHPAQGPVWGLTVTACFIVLLNGRICTDSKVNRILTTILAQGIRHRRSSVRALTCLAWRSLSWAYFQPPLPSDGDGESEVDEEVQNQLKHTKRALFKVMTSVMDCQTGIANIAAILGDEASRTTEEPLRLCVELLQAMARRSGHPCYDATQTMMKMVSAADDDSGEKEDQGRWEHDLLLPKSLLSPATNDLFVVDYKHLTQVIRPLFENLPNVGDVRPLTMEEMTKDWVLVGMMNAWRSALGHLELSDEADMPPELIKTWSCLLKANVGCIKDKDNISKFGVSVVKYITDILDDPDLDLAPSDNPKGVGPADRKNTIPSSDDTILHSFAGQTKCTNGELRLRVVRHMWNTMKAVFPNEGLRESSEALLAGLMRNEPFIIPQSSRMALDDEGEGVRNAWVTLCMDVLTFTDADAMKVFWGCEEGGSTSKPANTWGWHWTEEFTSAIWRVAVEKWREEEGGWEAGVVLLGVPFTDRHVWNMASEDFSLWEDFLGDLTAKALDHGVDSSTVLDHVALFVSSFQTPSAQPYLSIRLADLLLSHVDAQEMRSVPQCLVDLVADTMRSNYPPDESKKTKPVMRWLARSLMTLLEKCPGEFCVQILQTVQEGASLWLGDEMGAWEEDEMNYDLIPLYQHILLTVRGLLDPFHTLDTIAELLGSVFRHRAPSLAVDAFTDFWSATYANIPAPKAGWPQSIANALRIVGLLPSHEEQNGSVTSETYLAPVPRTPTSAPHSTPFLNRDRIRSPQRPTKVFGNFPLVPTSPETPTARRRKPSSFPDSVFRTPLSAIQLCESPSKRRRLNTDGKENCSSPPLVSVAERIAELLKQQPGASLKRKRIVEMQPYNDVDDTVPSPAKRLKTRMKSRPTPTTKAVIHKDREPWSVGLLKNYLDMPRSGSPTMVTTTTTVVTPQHSDTASVPRIDFKTFRRTIRRTNSTPEMLLKNLISDGKKRKRDDGGGSDGDGDDGQRSSLLLTRRRCTSRRTVSLPWRHDGRLDSDSTLVASSDDDSPFEGVKPLSRTLSVGDPSTTTDGSPLHLGSDDTATGNNSSSEEDSPTKGVVCRRMQRVAPSVHIENIIFA